MNPNQNNQAGGVTQQPAPQPVAQPVQQQAGEPQAPVQQVQPMQGEPQAPAQQYVQQQTPGAGQQQMGDRSRDQFEKLVDNNRKLFEANKLLQEEISRRTQMNQTFAPMQQIAPIQSAQPVQQPNPQDFVEFDPLTGEKFINERKLQAALGEASTRASRAEQVVQNYIQATEQREVARQEKEAFSSYPELNPTNSEKFDTGFSNQTSALILHSMMNPGNYGGRPLSFLEAANMVRGIGAGNQPANQPQTPALQAATQQPAQSTQDLKEQASVNVQSQPQQVMPAVSGEQYEALRDRTRRGDDDALARRILATDHIRKE